MNKTCDDDIDDEREKDHTGHSMILTTHGDKCGNGWCGNDDVAGTVHQEKTNSTMFPIKQLRGEFDKCRENFGVKGNLTIILFQKPALVRDGEITFPLTAGRLLPIY